MVLVFLQHLAVYMEVANDDFVAVQSRLIAPGRPVFNHRLIEFNDRVVSRIPVWISVMGVQGR